MRNGFFKGHGLGNDYLVVDPDELDFRLTPARIRTLCDRHLGVGSDGLLVLVPSKRADFGLRIYNPDGSEAEKSGNGLRIFARFLDATGRTRRRRYRVETPGGVVTVSLTPDRYGDASDVTIGMGTARFDPAALPCNLDVPELVDQRIRVGSRSLRFTGVSVGNPHCVVFLPKGKDVSSRELHTLGPALETHPIFPRFTNVQLVVPRSRQRLAAWVWERGAGATEASGSSACAVAAAAVRRGVAKSPVSIVMPGGVLEVDVDADYAVTLRGPVEEVARGRLAPSFVRSLSGKARRS
ncbi:MAG: diaminopimelate epimerase [Myxococcota bacterium]